MVAALSQRLSVMYLLRLNKPAFLKTPLTKRVCIHVPVTDTFPRPSISSFDCRVPAVLFITLVLQFLMLLTKPAVRQLRAAWIRTWSLWLSWHFLTSLSGQKKSPTGFLPEGFRGILLCYCNDSMGFDCRSLTNTAIYCQTLPTFISGQKNFEGLYRATGKRYAPTHGASD